MLEGFGRLSRVNVEAWKAESVSITIEAGVRREENRKTFSTNLT